MKLIPEAIYYVSPEHRHMFWIDVLRQYPEAIHGTSYFSFLKDTTNNYRIFDGRLVAVAFSGFNIKYVPLGDTFSEVDFV